MDVKALKKVALQTSNITKRLREKAQKIHNARPHNMQVVRKEVYEMGNIASKYHTVLDRSISTKEVEKVIRELVGALKIEADKEQVKFILNENEMINHAVNIQYVALKCLGTLKELKDIPQSYSDEQFIQAYQRRVEDTSNQAEALSITLDDYADLLQEELKNNSKTPKLIEFALLLLGGQFAGSYYFLDTSEETMIVGTISLAALSLIAVFMLTINLWSNNSALQETAHKMDMIEYMINEQIHNVITEYNE